MDPIHPIVPGPLPIPAVTTPVERLQRIARERDRPARERQEQGRRKPPPAPPSDRDGEEDGEHPHIDVQA
ncbi:MAG TPA: hypothetical protein VIH71_06725 [Solirubrobacteraceae bacterium]